MELITIKEASEVASNYLNKPVTVSNVSYLIQYGRVAKKELNGSVMIDINDLLHYYKTHHKSKEIVHKERLGHDLNWSLSFSQYKEAETTKHVHRLHPYKGKFIPQLVEYFLDSRIDDFKKELFFKKGDTVLDPFCGSGTTLVQASELGMNAIGVDISAFNAHISNVKVGTYDIEDVKNEISKISNALKNYLENKKNREFEERLLCELKIFNDIHFPAPEFRRKVSIKQIDEKKYGGEREKEFLIIYEKLAKEYDIDLQTTSDSFINQWFIKPIRDEINFVFEHIKKTENPQTKKLLSIILSRTIRSCRATTHSDLATLIEPVTTTYYCKKHGKICKPLFSIASWWDRYSKDTVKRVEEFNKLRSNTYQKCLVGDSRTIDIPYELEKKTTSTPELDKKSKNRRHIFIPSLCRTYKLPRTARLCL